MRNRNHVTNTDKPVLDALRFICDTIGQCKPEDIADYLDVSYKQVLDILHINRTLLHVENGYIVGDYTKLAYERTFRTHKNVNDSLWEE